MMNKKKIEISKENIIFYYLIMIGILYLSYYFLEIVFDGQYFLSVFPNVSDDTFMDHFNSLNNAKFDPYQDKFSNYPAMACLLYKMFLSMIPAEFRGGDGFALRNIQTAMIPFIVYNVLVIWLIQVFVSEKSLLEKKSRTLFSILLLLSAPVVFTIERGNLIFLSFSLTMFFTFYFESENKVLREISFIALALAAAIKIYPAIFGFLLLKRKHVKETLRLVVYGLLAFVIPFFYYDGFESIKIMIQALGYTTNLSDKIGYGINLSLYNIIETFSIIYGTNISNIIIYIIYGIVLGLLFISFFIVKKKWQELLCMTLILIFFPKTNYYYAMIFMLLPFIEFLNEWQTKQEKWSFVEYIGLAIFTIILVPWPSKLIPIFTDYKFPVSYTMLVYYLALCWMALLMFIELVKVFSQKKGKICGMILFSGAGVFSVLTVVTAMLR